ncbi:unnamed protein product [Mytilus coruscus]|uniref:PHD-type domain-containing protein n=1 Tax=Mytilus coruscus TaxID=42192 RepID=A0A6J8DVU3_MYTCO|nr:unnamed protein product [Mytilus coruscus]
MKCAEVSSQNTQDQESENIASIKCNRKCRTKSTYCSTGNHWVHYRCQKLTQEDITEAEKDSKKLAIPNTLQIANCDQIKDLLQEEVTSRSDETTMGNKDLCFVCDQQTDNTPWDVCDLCNNVSHTNCMNIENNEHHCNACIGSEIMEDATTVIKTDTLPINQHYLIESIDDISEENTSTDESEATPKTVISSNSPQPKQSVLKKIVLPERITKVSLQTQEELQLKHSELRERELKLRKTEEQLKLREKVVNEYKKERILLETRCQRLEARNCELEQTVKSLRKSIEMSNLSEETSRNEPVHTNVRHPMQTCQPVMNDVFNIMQTQLNNKVLALHEKLTNIVFSKIDKQLDKISLADTNEMEQINPEMNNVERSIPLQSKQDKKETEEINPQINNIERNTLLQSKQDKTPITTKNTAVTAPQLGQPIQNNAQRYILPSSTVNNWNLANSRTGQPLVYRGYQKYSLQQPIDQAGAPFNQKQGISNQQMLNNTTTEKIIQSTNANFSDRPGLKKHNI